MTDRKLLELAAKAAGIDYHATREDGTKCIHDGRGYWNPLADDGDALRLAVRLGISIDHDHIEVGVLTAGDMAYGEYTMGVLAWKVAVNTNIKCEELHGHDPLAATRLAIVRAAAEIGRQMP